MTNTALNEARSIINENSYLPSGARKYSIHGSHDLFIETVARIIDMAELRGRKGVRIDYSALKSFLIDECKLDYRTSLSVSKLIVSNSEKILKGIA